MNPCATETSEATCEGRVSDGDLLDRFVGYNDEDAFAALVSRYCGLVLGACRRILHDEHIAEDAFQATFLVLARQASRVRLRTSLAAWLHAVACRTAWRAGRKRRMQHEEVLRDDVAVTDDILTQIASRHEQRLLDEELDRLPARYREPLVLRYLMGKSNRQVAAELGLSLGVVEGRLKRGKDCLRVNLAKRGVALTAALAAIAASSETLAANDSLIAATAQTAAAFRSGAPTGDGCSQDVIQLAEGELAMSTSGTVATVSGVVVAVVIGGLALAWPGAGGETTVQVRAAAVMPASELAVSGDLKPVRLAMAEKQSAGEAPTAASEADDPFGAPSPSGGQKPAPQMMPGMEPQRPSAGSKSRAAAAAPSASKRQSGGRAVESLAERKIAEALDEPTTLEFVETPLADVIDYLKELHRIEIQIDYKGLDDVGIADDTPITRNLKGVSFRTALRLVLRDLQLTYTDLDGVLLITTPQEAQKTPLTRVYPVADLVGREVAVAGDSNWLTKAILGLRPQGEIQPEAITEASIAGQPVLIVAETYTTHEEIERLLSELRAIAKTPAGGPMPPK